WKRCFRSEIRCLFAPSKQIAVGWPRTPNGIYVTEKSSLFLFSIFIIAKNGPSPDGKTGAGTVQPPVHCCVATYGKRYVILRLPLTSPLTRGKKPDLLGGPT
ncbi:hypothetical protein, partial [Thalassospira sp.]|uniref:hypothetical protein n=1 Tax=Thalassospira sp. TaxID=1912094 RepID=UPI0031202DF8